MMVFGEIMERVVAEMTMDSWSDLFINFYLVHSGIAYTRFNDFARLCTDLDAHIGRHRTKRSLVQDLLLPQ